MKLNAHNIAAGELILRTCSDFIAQQNRNAEKIVRWVKVNYRCAVNLIKYNKVHSV